MRKLLSALAVGVFATATYGAQASDTDGLATAVTKDARPKITAEQRDRLATKLRMINQIMRAAEPDMQAQQTSVESRRWLVEKLYTMSLEQVQAVGVPGSFAATSNALSKAEHTKALGSTGSDLVYRPIDSCRFIDTRNVGGPISGSRQFDLDAIGSTYGGSASCNIVSAAGILNADDMAAVAINVAIVSPTAAPGFIGARPPGSANTTALVNWYQSGAQVQASNAGAIPTGQAGPNEIEFFGSPTQIIVDVFGVFTRDDATALDCITTGGNSVNVVHGVATETEVAATACPTGYTHVSVLCSSQSTQAMYLAKTGLNGDFSCSYINLDTVDHNGIVRARCCRVPGR